MILFTGDELQESLMNTVYGHPSDLFINKIIWKYFFRNNSDQSVSEKAFFFFVKIC